MCNDPLEIFSYLYDKGIGSKQSLLYETWSCELERLGNFKRADVVFVQGIEIGAQPLEQLQRRHK